MGELLDSCVRITGGQAELRWITSENVSAAGISELTELPLWASVGSESHAAVYTGDVTRALDTGLRCRSIEATVADTWAWLAEIPEAQRPLADGLSEQRETHLLAATARPARTDESRPATGTPDIHSA